MNVFARYYLDAWNHINNPRAAFTPPADYKREVIGNAVAFASLTTEECAAFVKRRGVRPTAPRARR